MTEVIHAPTSKAEPAGDTNSIGETLHTNESDTDKPAPLLVFTQEQIEQKFNEISKRKDPDEAEDTIVAALSERMGFNQESKAQAATNIREILCLKDQQQKVSALHTYFQTHMTDEVAMHREELDRRSFEAEHGFTKLADPLSYHISSNGESLIVISTHGTCSYSSK